MSNDVKISASDREVKGMAVSSAYSLSDTANSVNRLPLRFLPLVLWFRPVRMKSSLDLMMHKS